MTPDLGAQERRRVQMFRGRSLPPEAKYVGRPTVWGNPWLVSHVGRRTAVANYREALLTGALAVSIADVQRELRGRDLVCWCKPDEDCHADILLLVADGICPQCEGSGEERHPMWGARNCPEPTILCKVCGGTGVVGDGGGQNDA